jgi:hypothetical protein
MLEKFYPEVLAKGSLRAALEDALANRQSRLVPTDVGDFLPVAYARVEAGNRFTQVYMASERRLFIAEFWMHGIAVAAGKCSDFVELATAVSRWNSNESCRLAELAGEFAWIQANERGVAFEKGREVEWGWQQLIAREERHKGELREFVALASREPRLRKLFPYVSLNSLSFNRGTGHPRAMATPIITPDENGNFNVRSEDEKLVGGSSEAAVRFVIDHLPPELTAGDSER